MPTKTGRNDPCPCGSGKKYKYCCLSSASVANDEFQNLIAGQDFNSLEELQAEANNFMQQRNQQPHDDFQGLSSEQVHRMLHFPFDTPEFYNFPEKLRTEPEAPILTLIQWIANATDEKGLKATAKGNLPQKLCKEAFVDYRKYLPENDFHHRMKINREDDFVDLHACRSRILMRPLEDRHGEVLGRLGIQQRCRVPLLVRDDRPARRHPRTGVFATDGSNPSTTT